MNRIEIVDADRHLIECLADAASENFGNDLSQLVLVLPTSRLATFLQLALAARHSSIRPPQLMTLPQWLNDCAARYGDGRASLREISNVSLSQMIVFQIHFGSFRHLRVEHAAEIALIFNQLHDFTIGSAGFQKLREVLAEDIYRNDTHLGSLGQRVDELENLYHLVRRQMQDQGFGFASEIQAEQLEQVRKYLAENAADVGQLLGRKLWLAGYTSLLPVLEPLLKILQASDHCRLFFNRSEAHTPLAQILGRLFKLPSPRTLPSGVGSIYLVDVANPIQECYYCAESCRRLLESGVPASRIGLVITDELIYGEGMQLAFRQLGLMEHINLAVARPLSQTPLGTLLLATQAAVMDQVYWPMATHPLIREVLGDGLEITSELVELGQVPAALVEILEPLAQEEKQSIETWLSRLQEFIDGMAGVYLNADGSEEAFAVRTAWRQFKGQLLSLGFPHQLMNFKDFFEVLLSPFLSSPIRRIGEPLSGIQVLSLAEARNIPFQVVLVVGCFEGGFPKGLPRDDVLDDFLKRRMGLAGWAQLEAMEDLSFSLVSRGCERLIMTRPRIVDDEVRIPSRFVERLGLMDSSGNGLQIHKESLSIVRLADGLAPASSTPPQPTLPLKELPRAFSATSLGRYLNCPLQFRLSQLKLSELELVSAPELDPRRQGEFLHRVIEQYCQQPLSDPQKAVERLTEISHHLVPETQKSSPLLQQLSSQSWPRLVAHWAQLSESGNAGVAMLSEWEFAANKAIVVNGVSRRFHGVMDSVILGEDLVVITDYKRRTPPTNSAALRGEVPQLIHYALALAAERGLDRQNFLVGYWNILEGRWQPVAVGDLARDRAVASGLCSKRCASLNEAVDSLVKIWLEREGEVQQKRAYFAREGLCQYCSYDGLCRKAAGSGDSVG